MGHVSGPSRFRGSGYDDRMTRRLFIFDEPDRFVAGTVGAPGQRSFYLQARKAGALVSVAVEKTQVAVLADRLGDLLDTLQPDTAEAAADGSDQQPLDEPVIEAFRVGAMALAWDAGAQAVVVEAQPLDDDADYREVPDDDPEGPDLLRVRLSPDEARAFVSRSLDVVGAGRPPCPFCGMPLEPTGHFCLRSNGRLN